MSANVFDLTGKVALVTGASSGLGQQFACTLASAGAKVILAARRLDKLQDLQNQMQANGQEAIVVPLDVTDQKSIETAVSMAYEQAGEIDILVGTPGRVMDLALDSVIRFDDTQKLVIDEFDEMLNLGFRVQLTSILAMMTRNKRQNILFSATMTDEVDAILNDFFDFPIGF